LSARARLVQLWCCGALDSEALGTDGQTSSAALLANVLLDGCSDSGHWASGQRIVGNLIGKFLLEIQQFFADLDVELVLADLMRHKSMT
jgi:hypothetical protein